MEALAEELEGDWCAVRAIQIGDKGYSLEIYSITRDKVRFVDEQMQITPISDDGAYICGRIARDFGLKAGDEISFDPYDSNEHYTVKVAGVLDSMTESVVMTAAFANAAEIPFTVSTIFTDREGISAGELVTNVQSKQSIMDSFDTFMDLMNKMVWLLVLAAVVLGIIIGIPAGVGVLQYLITALASEYELQLALGAPTWLISILLTFGVSLIVGLMISRKNRTIDMVAALKTEE